MSRSGLVGWRYKQGLHEVCRGSLAVAHSRRPCCLFFEKYHQHDLSIYYDQFVHSRW